MKIKNRHFIKTGDIKKFQTKIEQYYPNSQNLFGKDCKMESGHLEDGTTFYFIDGELSFIEKDDHIFPFLKLLLKNLIQLPKITVDMGAVPYIAKGADVMLPGIVATDQSIKKDDYIVIVDEKHNKPLAIGIVLVDKIEPSKEEKGRVIKNIHYVGDKLWEFVKN
ncbi:MAG TPA: RNA-binding protein [Candidatus Deferrimicrobium sp.]|nr:RNA-binding protein [Candidatus Deferrimicrobium sp.]